MGKGGYNGGSTVIHAGSGWFGKGSVTSQPAAKKKKPPESANPKRKKKAQKGNLGLSSKGNGLTRADIVAKATQRVRTIESEIAKTKQRLATLERDLAQAIVAVKAAQSLPSKTVQGFAHHATKRTMVTPVTVKPKSRKLTDAERKAEREARLNDRTAPKESVVEEHTAGSLVGKRIVERS